MNLTEADRWRLVAAFLAAVCIIMGLMLRSALERTRVAERRTAHAVFDCYTSPEDREHS